MHFCDNLTDFEENSSSFAETDVTVVAIALTSARMFAAMDVTVVAIALTSAIIQGRMKLCSRQNVASWTLSWSDGEGIISHILWGPKLVARVIREKETC